MISDLDPSLAPKLIKPNQWDRLKFTLASGKKEVTLVYHRRLQQQITDFGSLVSGCFIKKICTLIVEMGGNLGKKDVLLLEAGMLYLCVLQGKLY